MEKMSKLKISNFSDLFWLIFFLFKDRTLETLSGYVPRMVLERIARQKPLNEGHKLNKSYDFSRIYKDDENL